MEDKKYIENKEKQFIAPTYTRSNIILKHGKGATVYDECDNEYIDFTSGIGVNSFGFADKELLSAVFSQANLLQHTSNLYYTEPQIDLAELLCKKTYMDKVFFSNSGAEANECAIKYARKYSFDKYGSNRYKIITLQNSFHGRTITTLAATGQEEFHNYFGPFTEGFLYCEPNNIKMLEEMITDDVCAIMFEAIQGEGGVCCLDEEFLCKMEELANQNDLILIADEVQCGNGRTGKYFAYMHFGIHPDIVSTAKGIAGGFPMGVTLFSEKLSHTITLHSHGSTFGGNPAIASGAITVVKRLTDDFMKEVTEKGNYIKEYILALSSILEVSGMGLMIGIKSTHPTSEIKEECEKNGLLVLTAKDKVRLLPPLNITYYEIDRGLKILKEVIEK